MTMTVHPARATVLIAATGAAAWLLAQEGAAQAALPPNLDSLVTAGVLLGGAVAGLGVAVLTIAALAESLLGWRPRAAGALPVPLRRFLMGSIAAALVVGAAIPANADEVYPGWVPASPAASASPSAVASPTPWQLSPSPVVTAAPAAEPAPPAAPAPLVELHAESAAPPLPDRHESPANHGHAERGVHVVARGDSLWRITAELLGPDASNSAIASAWPLIYQANRSVIGNDPGLIQPGQLLTIPQEVAA